MEIKVYKKKTGTIINKFDYFGNDFIYNFTIQDNRFSDFLEEFSKETQEDLSQYVIRCDNCFLFK